MNMLKLFYLWMAFTAFACGFWGFAYVPPIGLDGAEYALIGIIGFGMSAYGFTKWQEMKP